MKGLIMANMTEIEIREKDLTGNKIDYDEKKREINLQLKDLRKMFSRTEGVASVDLTVIKGELLTLLGPSGCGKTTVLRCIGGFAEPDSGSITLDGQSIEGLPPEKRPTAMVFQSYNQWPHMTVRENLAFGLKLRRIRSLVIDDAVKSHLKLVKMEGTENKYPSQLSGGQQQRVAIARALVLNP